MSKKVLNYAGKRPMLLAILVMATLTLGLLFSGWFTPTQGKAQPNQPNPPPSQENTNCVVTSVDTNCVSGGSVALVATTSAPVVCIGDTVNVTADVQITDSQSQTITHYDQCPDDVVDSTAVPSYGVTWTASVGSYSASGKGLTASFTPTSCGNGNVSFKLAYTNTAPCSSTGSSSTSGGFNVVEIQHQCVATTPTDQTRTTIGVGEEVDLTACGAPGTVTWTTSAGTVSPTTGTSTTLTAPDRKATALVTASYNGGSCTKSFSVIEPTAINMLRVLVKHDYNTATIGMKPHVFVAPDSVNFGAVSVRELSANFLAGGVYTSLNNTTHGTTVSNPSTGKVWVTHGTWCVNDDECLVSGFSTYDPAHGTGYAICSIPCQWQCNSSAWVNFQNTSDQAGHSSGASSHQLTISKDGASWSCSVYDPTCSY